MYKLLNTVLESSWFNWVWGGIVIFCAGFFAVYFPLHILYELSLHPFHISMQWIATIIFLLDIGVNFLKIQNPHTRLDVEIPHSRKQYLKRWFLFDLLAVIPLGWLTGWMYPGLLRMTKLVSASRIMNGWTSRAGIHQDALRLTLSFFWVLLITHWIACGWAALQKVDAALPWYEDYLNALYWAITTITTVGYGDVVPENIGQKIFAMVTMFSGLIFYGYLIGNIAGILFKRDPVKEMYLANLQRLAATSRQYNLPASLEQKVHQHFTDQWKNRRGYYEKELLDNLPESLRAEVNQYIRKAILQQIPLFQGAGKAFLDEVAYLLRKRLVEPGEYLFQSGDPGTELFFVLHGRLEVLDPAGEKVVHTLVDGDYFGEIALFKDQPRLATVRAASYSDLYYLSRNAFLEAIERHPQSKEEIEKLAARREAAFRNL